MGFLFRDTPEEEPLQIEHADELDMDTKILLINSIDLLNKTRNEWHRRGVDIDMTLRMQLKTDCRDMENAIRAVDSRMCTPAKVQKLQNMYKRLAAEADIVLNITVPDLS